MEQVVFDTLIKQGPFAMLFVWILITTLKKNEERENRYQTVIDKNQEIISAQAKAFESLSDDVKDIKNKILG